MPREALLAQTLVELADTLVDDFDVVELLTLLADRCVEVLDVSAAGLLLVAPEGDLRVMASSSEAMRVLELFELQAERGSGHGLLPHGRRRREPGPGHGERPLAPTSPPKRWPPASIPPTPLPMRLRATTLGALNLFRGEPGAMDAADIVAAQAFADVASIAVLQHRAAHEAQIVNEQLTHALNSRIVIEQAKGVLAERTGLDMEQAFTQLRQHARNHNLRLVDVARDVIAGVLPAAIARSPTGRCADGSGRASGGGGRAVRPPDDRRLQGRGRHHHLRRRLRRPVRAAGAAPLVPVRRVPRSPRPPRGGLAPIGGRNTTAHRRSRAPRCLWPRHPWNDGHDAGIYSFTYLRRWHDGDVFGPAAGHGH